MDSNQAKSVIYKANPQFVEMVDKTRKRCHSVCSKHFYQPVKVETMQGRVYEGRIVNVDQYHLYLEVTQPAPMRQFFPPFGTPYGYASPYQSVILPLVLFDLLAITLLYP